MSDDEYETTNVVVEKPKKERTPAQKAATARALEALAAAREAKKPGLALPVVKAKPAPKTNVVSYNAEPHAPAAAPAPRPTPRAAPEPKDYSEDIKSLSEGLHSVISYIEARETKKQAKPKAKRPSPPSSSEDDEEPAPEPKKKGKMTKAAPPVPDYQLKHQNPQDVLRNIFWRNM
jgi:hypothetical protein